MVQQLIVTTMLLLIYDAPKAIQYVWTILDFTMLTPYILYDNKMLYYIEHALYRLEKIKIAFKYYWPIDSKLYQPTINYPEFYIISYFI